MKARTVRATFTRSVAARPFLVCLALWACLACGSRAEDAFPDDFADSAGLAGLRALPFTTNGVIEIDVDRDVFAFAVQKGRQYTLTATRGTLRDTAFVLRGVNGQGVVAQANSVTNGTASFTWANVAGDYTVYLDVGGFAEFTTGTYTCAISAGVAIVDSDGDGLPDVWEQYYFKSLAQGAGGDTEPDGLTHIEELYLGTDPTVANDGLRITKLEMLAGSQQQVTWTANPLRQYRLTRSAAVSNAVWTVIGTVTGTNSSATFVDPGAGSVAERYYRVEMPR